MPTDVHYDGGSEADRKRIPAVRQPTLAVGGYAGEHYQIPFAGPDATGLGKPLKSIMHGNPKMKIYTASIAPASIRNSAEIADGMFPRFMNPQRFELFEPHLDAGFAKSGSQKSLATYTKSH